MAARFHPYRAGAAQQAHVVSHDARFQFIWHDQTLSTISRSTNLTDASVTPILETATTATFGMSFLHLEKRARQPNTSNTVLNDPVKIAAFDLDGTLIRNKSGRQYPSSPLDWCWWSDSVPLRLQKLHENGYKLLIVTNQAGLAPIAHHLTQPFGKATRKKWTAAEHAANRKVKDFCTRAESICDALSVPMDMLIACQYDNARKPRAGLWHFFTKCLAARKADNSYDTISAMDPIQVDLENSFYVGDAAGRADDRTDCDRKFAINAGISFHSTESYFGESDSEHFRLEGIDPVQLFETVNATHSPETRTFKISSFSSVIANHLEMVLLVGPPSSGKTFYARHFLPNSYLHLHVPFDEKAVDATIQQARNTLAHQRSVIIDGRLPLRVERQRFIQQAKQLNVSCRILYFDVEPSVAEHLDAYRMTTLAEEGIAAQTTHKRHFEKYVESFQPFDKEGVPVTVLQFKDILKRDAVKPVFWNRIV